MSDGGNTPALDVTAPAVAAETWPSRVEGDPGEIAAGTALGRYVILKRLGGGGMGIVYLAFDNELERRVAIKVLRPDSIAGAPEGEARARLLREAQAMAKVSHPNVVSVFDVGTFGAEVFIAMEYVSGATLRAWLGASKRSAKEIVAAFVQAGRGLGAAHAEGILHRDFKPDNVVVDERGRVKVLDFGLARLDGGTEVVSARQMPSPNLALEDTGVNHRAALATPLTSAGTILGTPAYMAPEQLVGKPADARTDQFSFSVALFEALYGARPFEGRSPNDLARAIYEGGLKAVPAAPGVPRAVERAVRRGLSGAPDKRFASMGELLAELEAAFVSRRRWVGGAGAGAALVLGGVVVAARARPESLCRGAGEAIAPAWSAPRAEEVARAFKASGSPRPDEAFAHARPILDRYAAAWIATRTEACESTRVRGTQSSEALDLRMGCLDQRAKELKATVDLLAHADEKLVEGSVEAAAKVKPVEECNDIAALRAPFAPPKDETQRQAVEEARRQLADVDALLNAGKFEEAAPRAAALVEEATKAGYGPLRAEALLAVGEANSSLGNTQIAFDGYFESAVEAERDRHDVVAAHAWRGVVWASATLRNFAEAGRYVRVAEATIDRVPDRDLLRAELLVERARLATRQNLTAEARANAEQAVAIRARLLGPDAPLTLEARSQLADATWYAGAVEESVPVYEELYRTRLRTLGETHIATLRSLGDLADVQTELGDYAAAAEYAGKELRLAHVGWQLAGARVYLGQALACGGDLAGGKATFEQGATALVPIYGPRVVGGLTADFARRLVQRGLDADAEAYAGRALAIFGADGKLGPQGYSALGVRALCEARRGAVADAIRDATQAIDATDKQLGPRGDMIPLLARGDALLTLRRAPEALVDLEHALSLADATKGEVAVRAEIRFAVARALAATKGDPARAATLAKRAAGELDATKLPAAAAKVKEWLATNDATSTLSAP